MTKEQELNKKLAEWVGFKQVFTNKVGTTLGVLYSPEYEILDFTQSLDACFKWLVPKLNFWQLTSYWQDSKKVVYAIAEVAKCPTRHYGIAENPASALCLVIEKLIDKEA